MKLTNLSLAIMVAVGVAACGGSDDNNSNKPADPTTPNTPSTPNTNNDTTTNDKQIVDPTGTQVVDDKDLTTQTTVGTLQYIRRDDSRYDRDLNPSNPASASPLLGVTLNDQNPSLTNIVLARQNVTRADGVAVKAQFTGSDNPKPLNLDGTVINDGVTGLTSLQQENFNNVDILASYDLDTEQKAVIAGGATATEADLIAAQSKHYQTDNLNKQNKFTREMISKAYHYDAVDNGERKYNGTNVDVTALLKAKKVDNATGASTAAGYVDKNGKPFFEYQQSRKAGTDTFVSVKPSDAKTSSLGKDLVWWSAPEYTFETTFSRNAGETPIDDIKFNLNSVAATSGLVRVGGDLPTLGQELNFNPETGKWEDHHNTTTRIFGRYHLATVDNVGSKLDVKPVSLNTFTGAKSFTAEYKEGDAAKKATSYSIGAVPGTLNYVQYGRVTTNLDLDEGVAGYPDGFIRNPYKNKNDSTAVDNYFYRGTNATTIEQMAALPSDQVATYQGHALMYGIDNNYHGSGGRNLPNAFAGTVSGHGLGNFVEAQANFGTKRVIGKVYNEWLLDEGKAATTRDNLVQFQGQITGNTVVGTADRTYITGDDNATFKGSFFGEKAQELGGSFNSVTDKDKYGSAYGTGDWGGVFGATKGSSGNTFQGDDGANNYGSL